MLRDLGCFDEITLDDVAINPRTGRRYQIILTKIDLKLKFDAMGNPNKYKGRLVVRMGGQPPRRVLPTVNSKTINLLLSLAAQQGMTL